MWYSCTRKAEGELIRYRNYLPFGSVNFHTHNVSYLIWMVSAVVVHTGNFNFMYVYLIGIKIINDMRCIGF